MAMVRRCSRPFSRPDRQRIQQRLGRVFMLAVTGVQHRAVDLLGQQVHRAGMRVAHDQKVRVHRVQRQRGINQRLAFFDRACLHRHVHHIRTQPLARNLETRLGAGRVLEKHVDLRQPLQGFRAFHRLPVQVDIAVGQVQDRGDFGGVQRFDAQKMALAECHGGLRMGLA